MITKRIQYRGFTLRLHDTQDSFWVSVKNKTFEDCTERHNDEESAFEEMRNMIDGHFKKQAAKH